MVAVFITDTEGDLEKLALISTRRELFLNWYLHVVIVLEELDERGGALRSEIRTPTTLRLLGNSSIRIVEITNLNDGVYDIGAKGHHKHDSEGKAHPGLALALSLLLLKDVKFGHAFVKYDVSFPLSSRLGLAVRFLNRLFHTVFFYNFY